MRPAGAIVGAFAPGRYRAIGRCADAPTQQTGKCSIFFSAAEGGAALKVEPSVIAHAAGRSICSAWGHPLRARFSRRSSCRPIAQGRPRAYTVLPCDFPSRSSGFCRYPLPMSDWSCSRALPEERTVPSRSKVRFSSVSGSSAPAMRYAQALRYARRRMRKTGVA